MTIFIRNYPLKLHPSLSWLLTFFLIYLSVYLLRNHGHFRLSGIPVSWTLGAFALKLIAMFSLIWIYSYHYTNRSEADIYKYFDDGVLMSHIAWHDPMGFAKALTGISDEAVYQQSFELNYWDRPSDHEIISSNRLIIRFNALLALVSGGNIWFHSTVACLLAFWGLMLFYKGFVAFVEGRERLFFVLLFVSPSLLFWSSGVLKEAFLIFGLGLIFYTVELRRKSVQAWKIWLITWLGFWVVASVKLYLLLLFFPAAYAWFWSKKSDFRRMPLKYVVSLLFFGGFALNLPVWILGIDPLHSLTVHQQEFKCLAEWIGAGSRVHIMDLDGSLWSALVASPEALFNALLRPLPFDQLNMLSFPAMTEVLIGVFLMGMAVFKGETLNPDKKNLLYFCAMVVFIQALLIGWTTPVIGAIVRYRVPLLPFLFLGISLLFNRKYLPKVLCTPS